MVLFAIAFQLAAQGAFKEAYMKARPVIMEPIMKVAVEGPTEFQGAVMGSLNQRRGMILGSQDEGVMCVIESQVPLAEMFGYIGDLRTMTSGRGQFSMEFSHYSACPNSVSEAVIKEVKEREAAAKK